MMEIQYMYMLSLRLVVGITVPSLRSGGGYTLTGD